MVRATPSWGCGYVERDVDTIVAAFHGICLNAVVVASRRFPSERVVIPSMPWTTEETFLDRALAERSFLVGALVVESRVLPLVVRHAHGRQPAGDRFDAAVGKLVELERFVPNSHGKISVYGIRCTVYGAEKRKAKRKGAESQRRKVSAFGADS